MDKATLLQKLTISEVSGVDEPANEIRGWAVQKAEAAEIVTEDNPSTVLEKIRGLLGLSPDRKDDQLDMNADELKAILDERETALVEKVAEVVAKSVETKPEEAPAAPAAEAPTPEASAAAEAEAVTGLTEDDLTKAIQEALAPYHDILEKTLDRIESVEEKLGIAARKSLEGQETAGDEKPEESPSTKATGSEIGVVRHALANRARPAAATR